jgi:hypothetical protein
MGHTSDVISGMATKLEKLNLNTNDVLLLVIKEYGEKFIFLLLFFIGLIILLKNRKSIKNTNNLLILALATFFFGFIYFLYLFSILPGLQSINAQRLLSYTFLTIPVFLGIFYTFAFSKRKIIINIFCLILLISPPLLTLFAIIPSPYVFRPTPEATQMDLVGMKWAFQYKDIGLSCVPIMSPPYRYADILMGPTERKSRRDINRFIDAIPDHFNYQKNRLLGQTYFEDQYAIITQFDTTIYETVYKSVGRFKSSDFQRLQIDSSVNRIYSNKETNVYIIHGQLG